MAASQITTRYLPVGGSRRRREPWELGRKQALWVARSLAASRPNLVPPPTPRSAMAVENGQNRWSSDRSGPPALPRSPWLNRLRNQRRRKSRSAAAGSAGAGRRERAPLGPGTVSVLPWTVSEPRPRPALGLLTAGACACTVESSDGVAGAASEVALEASTAAVPPGAARTVVGAPAIGVPTASAEMELEVAGTSVLGEVAGTSCWRLGTSVLCEVAGRRCWARSRQQRGRTCPWGRSCCRRSCSSEEAVACAEVSLPGAGTVGLVVAPDGIAASAASAFVSVGVPEALGGVRRGACPVWRDPGGAAVDGGSGAVAAEDGDASTEAGGEDHRLAQCGRRTMRNRERPAVSTVPPRTRSHRWSAKTATRFGSIALPSRWWHRAFEPRSISVDARSANR